MPRTPKLKLMPLQKRLCPGYANLAEKRTIYLCRIKKPFLKQHKILTLITYANPIS